jgi:hypothetical protein
MGDTNHSKNADNENRKKRLAQLVTVLERYFLKWNLLPGSNQVTIGQMAVYAEALIDLSPEAVEFGCAEATKVAERFPWPGHIRKGAEGYRAAQDRSGYLGPALDWNPELEKERLERKAAFERGLADEEFLDRKLERERVEQAEQKPANPMRRGFRSIEEQKAELRVKGYL